MFKKFKNINNLVKLESDNTSEVQEVNENKFYKGNNILQELALYEVKKIQKYNDMTEKLEDFLLDDREVKKLTYHEKTNLLKFINRMRSDSRNFLLEFANVATKNAFLHKMFESDDVEEVSKTMEYVETDTEEVIEVKALLKEILAEKANGN